MPAGTDCFVHPRLIREFGGPSSTIQRVKEPSASLTSMWSQACGLIHSIFAVVPLSVSFLLPSNSAAKAWCANAGIEAAMNSDVARTAAVIVRIRLLSIFLRCCLGCLFLIGASGAENIHQPT